MNEINVSEIGFMCLSSFILLVYLVSVIFVLLKRKNKLDRLEITNISISILSFLLKETNMILFITCIYKETSNYVMYVDIISGYIITLNLYHLTFDMLSIFVLLDSQSESEYIKRSRKAKFLRILAFSLSIFFFSICLVIYFRKYILFVSEEDYLDPISIILTICRFIVLVIDLNVAYICGRLFSYFMIQKAMRIESEGRLMTLKHKMTMVYCIFVFVTYCFQLIAKFIFAPQSIQQTQESEMFNIFFELYRFAFLPLVDFLVATSLLYLFYYQSSISPMKGEEFETLATEVDHEDPSRTRQDSF